MDDNTDNIEITQDEIEKALSSILDISQEEAVEYISKAKKDVEEKEESEENEEGDEKGEENEDDMEKAYLKGKKEYDDMEKACADKKSMIEAMQAKMKGKMKKSETEDLGKKEQVDSLVKSITDNVKKSFEEDLNTKGKENEELKKSINEMGTQMEDLKKSMTDFLNTPQGGRGYVSESQIINKGETITEGGKQIVNINDKNTIIKSIESLMEKETDAGVNQRYEDEIFNLESGNVPPSKETLTGIMKADNIVFKS
jgi:hypothetical protein